MTASRPPLPLRLVKLYLDIVRILVWIAAGIYLIAMIWVMAGAPGRSGLPEITVPFGIRVPTQSLAGAREGLPVERPHLSAGQVRVRFGTGDLTAWLVYVLVIAAVLAAVWYGVSLMRALMRDVLAGRAFTRANSTRLRRVGLLVLGWQLLAPAARYLWARFTLDRFALDATVLRPRLGYDLEPFVLALAVLALAEIFRQAARLQEESDLTV